MFKTSGPFAYPAGTMVLLLDHYFATASDGRYNRPNYSSQSSSSSFQSSVYSFQRWPVSGNSPLKTDDGLLITGTSHRSWDCHHLIP